MLDDPRPWANNIGSLYEGRFRDGPRAHFRLLLTPRHLLTACPAFASLQNPFAKSQIPLKAQARATVPCPRRGPSEASLLAIGTEVPFPVRSMTVLSRIANDRGPRRQRNALRFVTFLAPILYPLYEFITRHAGRRLGLPTELAVGSSYAVLRTEAVDVAFVCGLPYVELSHGGDGPFEPLAAPVLRGERFGGRAIYFSDVIVHDASRSQSFADLRGCTWAYNEPHSQSGYGITRHHLICRGETNGYFGRVVQAGWHEEALRMVARGAVNAAAVDCHVLAVALRAHPELAAQVRIIDSLGPSTIQPVVAARRLPHRLRTGLRAFLLSLADDPVARPHLDRALVQGFAAVNDASYADIRGMLAAALAADFVALR
jgi:phosphonate transport system substrate-binding protein